MKHSLKITLILVALFLMSHLIGLYVINQYLPVESSLPLNIEKPQLEEQTSYVPIFIAIIIATGVALILIKFKALKIWKAWFFISVLFTLTVSFAAFIPDLIALSLALILAYFKTYKSNVYIHNSTELFVYGGLAAIFVPVLNMFSVVILLLLISVYDMVAVWKTKHMVSLAMFQSESKVFPGLSIPYKQEPIKKVVKTRKKESSEIAILGGGDIAFPLLFSGVVLKTFGFVSAGIVSLFAAVALLLLLLLARKQKFYPAMPFITAGCLLGLIIVKYI